MYNSDLIYIRLKFIDETRALIVTFSQTLKLLPRYFCTWRFIGCYSLILMLKSAVLSSVIWNTCSRNRGFVWRLNAHVCGSVQCQSCEHSNESAAYMWSREFLYRLNACQFLTTSVCSFIVEEVYSCHTAVFVVSPPQNYSFISVSKIPHNIWIKNIVQMQVTLKA